MDVAPGPRCAKHMCVPFIASKALSVVLMTTVADARVGFFFFKIQCLCPRTISCDRVLVF